MKKVLTIFMLVFSLLVLLNVGGYSVSYAQNINENVSVTRDDKGVWFISTTANFSVDKNLQFV